MLMLILPKVPLAITQDILHELKRQQRGSPLRSEAGTQSLRPLDSHACKHSTHDASQYPKPYAHVQMWGELSQKNYGKATYLYRAVFHRGQVNLHHFIKVGVQVLLAPEALVQLL